MIELYRTGHQRGFVIVSAGSDGLFAFDFSNPDNSDDVIGFFSNPANVKHGDTLRVECLLDTGDLVKLRSVVP